MHARGEETQTRTGINSGDWHQQRQRLQHFRLGYVWCRCGKKKKAGEGSEKKKNKERKWMRETSKQATGGAGMASNAGLVVTHCCGLV